MTIEENAPSFRPAFSFVLPSMNSMFLSPVIHGGGGLQYFRIHTVGQMISICIFNEIYSGDLKFSCNIFRLHKYREKFTTVHLVFKSVRIIFTIQLLYYLLLFQRFV